MEGPEGGATLSSYADGVICSCCGGDRDESMVTS